MEQAKPTIGLSIRTLPLLHPRLPKQRPPSEPLPTTEKSINLPPSAPSPRSRSAKRKLRTRPRLLATRRLKKVSLTQFFNFRGQFGG
jgi:hypothetical protein